MYILDHYIYIGKKEKYVKIDRGNNEIEQMIKYYIYIQEYI